MVAYLRQEEYLCEQAYTFKDALQKIQNWDYDCLILDINLPRGIRVLKDYQSLKNFTESNSLYPQICGLLNFNFRQEYLQRMITNLRPLDHLPEKKQSCRIKR